jgi:hypothetical protein
MAEGNEWETDTPEEDGYAYWCDTSDEILIDRYGRYKYGEIGRKPFGRRHLQVLDEIRRRGNLRGPWDNPQELAKFAAARLEA